MGTRYEIGDKVEIFGQSPLIKDRRHVVSKGSGIVIEIRGGGYYADYTQRRVYIVQLADRTRMCFASELRLIERQVSPVWEDGIKEG